MGDPARIDVKQVESADVDSSVYNLDEAHAKIYTRRIEGFYQNVQLYTGWPLLIGYFVTPWLMIEGRQAIFFDLPAREFHIFWLTFWPQDFVLLAWALVIAAFSLFFVTNLLGRVWCGYTCPQTVWTAIFMWAEQVAEGDRNQRIKLDAAPMSLNKLARRTMKHGMWIGFAFLTGLTFVSYFYGMYDLIADMGRLQVPFVATAWIGIFTAGTYANAGWMREQVCKYMCPYARFQSAMFDKNTLIVSYDSARGEQRGSRKRSAIPAEVGLGDCIDCSMCVQVCPTGIDIRDGLQYECINCARCVDACNSIMDKMGYEKGLVSYTTLNKLDGKGWTWKRPRLIGYGLAVTAMIVAFSTVLLTRIPLELDVLRLRGQLFQEIPGGFVQNTYTVKILNMSEDDRTFTLTATGLPLENMTSAENLLVPAGEIGEFSSSLIVNPDKLESAISKIEFEVTDGDITATSKSTFVGPEPLK